MNEVASRPSIPNDRKPPLPREMAEFFDGTEAQVLAYERLEEWVVGKQCNATPCKRVFLGVIHWTGG